MAAKAEVQNSTADTLKLALAALLPLLAIGAFVYFSDESLLLRWLALVATVLVSGVIAGTTAWGRQALIFVREARAEVRRMVWPSRQETVQTTIAVFVIVIIVAIMLWLIDSALGWTVRQFLAA